LLCFGNSVA